MWAVFRNCAKQNATLNKIHRTKKNKNKANSNIQLTIHELLMEPRSYKYTRVLPKRRPKIEDRKPKIEDGRSKIESPKTEDKGIY